MPIFDYKCEHCGANQEVFRHDSGSFDCWKCGGKMRRQWTLGRGIRSGEKGYWSSAMGVSPDQVNDELRRHPDWQFNKNGDLWVKDPHDKKKKLKELGMTDFQ